MKRYTLTLKSDTGIFRVTTTAQSRRAAIGIVCQAENCPRSAVLTVKASK